MVLYHVLRGNRPLGRRCHYRGSSTPRSSCPAAASSPSGRGGRPGPARGQNGQPKWRPEFFFFLFLRYEVEIPRRRGVEIPPRIRLSLPQVMAPPQLRGDPCEANLPGLFPTKMAGLRSTSEPSGLFPANYDSAGLQSIFAAIHPEFQVRRESFTRLAGGGNGRRKPAHNVGADTWPRPAPLGG